MTQLAINKNLLQNLSSSLQLLTPRTLFGRISILFIVFIASLVVIHHLIFSRYWKVGTDLALQSAYATITEKLANQIQPIVASGLKLENLAKLSRDIKMFNPQVHAYILNDEARVVADLNSLTKVQSIQVLKEPLEDYINSISANFPIYNLDPSNNLVNNVFSASPLTIAGQKAYLYLIYKNPLHQRPRWKLFTNSTEFRTFSYIVLTALFASIVGVISVRLLMNRFYIVTRIIKEFQSGNFNHRIRVRSNDEIDNIAITVNSMADRIELSLNDLANRDSLRRELVANVSHDIRGPVALIKGFSGEIVKHQQSPLSEERIDYISRLIQNNIDSLGQLLSELFELGQLEAKEIRPEFKPFPANELIEEMYSIYRTAAETRKKITVSLETINPLVLVLGDRAMIARVLTNLIENAIRYTPENGKIKLSCELLTDSVRFVVLDTGVGIPESDIPYLFDRFFRVEKSPVQSSESSGLGLAIVRRIIQLHSSKINVSSTLNQGSCFSFELPKTDL